MTDLTLKVGCPDSEISPQFLQGMVDRMGTSFYKYGKVKDAYPIHVNAIDSLLERLRMYRRDGNLEWLMDVANFAMIEFMCPSRDNAHYTPQDSYASPGRKVTHGDRLDSNDDLRER